MKKQLLAAAAVVVVIGALILLYARWKSGTTGSGDANRPTVGTAAAGTQAPAFSLPDLSGNVFDSSRLAGKPSVINFFATWCPPCREEIPGFVDVYGRYRTQGLEIVGIALDTDTRNKLSAFVEGNGIVYQVLLGDVATAKAYGGVSAIPTTFFVGRDGVIRKVHVGFIDRNAFEREIRNLL